MSRQHKQYHACIVGNFPSSDQYSSNQSLTHIIKQISKNVSFCQADTTVSPSSINNRFSFYKYLAFLRRSLYGIFKSIPAYLQAKDIDFVFIGYPAYLDIIFIHACRALGKKPKIVINAFLGLHDTIVHDRKLVKASSIFSRIFFQLEKFALQKADLIVIDTRHQADLLANTYKIDNRKFIPLPVGIDENLWKYQPLAAPTDRFRVCIWLTFIPLHGITTVARAAKKLLSSSVDFRITVIGDGQTADAFEDELIQLGNPGNLEWIRRVLPQEQVCAHARAADCILGIFSGTEKSKRVVPYKIYQSMALGRPFISSDTPAMRSLLSPDLSHHTLIPAQNEHALAERLLFFAENRSLLPHIASLARATFDEKASQERQKGIFSRKLESCLK